MDLILLKSVGLSLLKISLGAFGALFASSLLLSWIFSGTHSLESFYCKVVGVFVGGSLLTVFFVGYGTSSVVQYLFG